MNGSRFLNFFPYQKFPVYSINNSLLTNVLQIWQEDGLNLCLIPYGCVATGPNSGIIEVVKDAKTIADVRISCTNITTKTTLIIE